MNNTIIVNSQKFLQFIAHAEIVYCKSDNSYTTLFLVNKEEVTVCRSLAKIEEELNCASFIRVNQSFIVNVDYIKLIDKKKKTIELQDLQKIPFTTAIKTLISFIIKNAA